jgi:hypothetical protein
MNRIVFSLRLGFGHGFRDCAAAVPTPMMPAQKPLWNLFDLIPEGRGTNWDEQLSYSCCRADH